MGLPIGRYFGFCETFTFYKNAVEVRSYRDDKTRKFDLRIPSDAQIPIEVLLFQKKAVHWLLKKGYVPCIDGRIVTFVPFTADYQSDKYNHVVPLERQIIADPANAEVHARLEELELSKDARMNLYLYIYTRCATIVPDVAIKYYHKALDLDSLEPLVFFAALNCQSDKCAKKMLYRQLSELYKETENRDLYHYYLRKSPKTESDSCLTSRTRQMQQQKEVLDAQKEKKANLLDFIDDLLKQAKKEVDHSGTYYSQALAIIKKTVESSEIVKIGSILKRLAIICIRLGCREELIMVLKKLQDYYLTNKKFEGIQLMTSIFKQQLPETKVANIEQPLIAELKEAVVACANMALFSTNDEKNGSNVFVLPKRNTKKLEFFEMQDEESY